MNQTAEQKVDFSTFIMSLASASYSGLGRIPNPITQKTEKNLVLAKQHIDILEILEEKTKGNLSENEDKLLESILGDLRMAYVEELKNSAH